MPLKAVGIELEGGWTEPPKGTILTHDVSVLPPKGFTAGFQHWGEAVSPILAPEKVEGWIRHNYPTHIPRAKDVGTPQERSCGLHVHVSFDEVWEYRVMVQKRYHQFLLDGYEEWGKSNLSSKHIFWHRWRGGNRFCTRDFSPHVQMKWKEKGHNRPDRRTHLNYTWGYLGTVEWRMLPMFPDPVLRPNFEEKVQPQDIDLAVDSVRVYLELTREWLKMEGAREKEREVLHRSLLLAAQREKRGEVEYEIPSRKPRRNL